jgi:hypothetical protein
MACALGGHAAGEWRALMRAALPGPTVPHRLPGVRGGPAGARGAAAAQHAGRARKPAGARRWIHARLVGERKNKRRRETDLLAVGRREVEGRPPDGPREWDPDELAGGIDDLSRGLRCAPRGGSRRAPTSGRTAQTCCCYQRAD